MAGWASSLAGWSSGLPGWPRGGDKRMYERTYRWKSSPFYRTSSSIVAAAQKRSPMGFIVQQSYQNLLKGASFYTTTTFLYRFPRQYWVNISATKLSQLNWHSLVYKYFSQAPYFISHLTFSFYPCLILYFIIVASASGQVVHGIWPRIARGLRLLRLVIFHNFIFSNRFELDGWNLVWCSGTMNSS